jgi:hypothetical protein
LGEYRDGGEPQRVGIIVGQADWDEPTNRVHRAINVGTQSYDEIAVFLLDHPDTEAQPKTLGTHDEGPADDAMHLTSARGRASVRKGRGARAAHSRGRARR